MGAFTSRQNVAVEESEQSSNHYKYPPRSGNFFGSHFIMGGERFDVPQPESYLFGENSDLNFLGNRPTAFPYPPPQATEPTKTLKSLVNIRKESVRFVRVAAEEKQVPPDSIIIAPSNANSSKSKSQEQLDGNALCTSGGGDGGAQTPYSYNIEFTFDSDVKCAITVYYFCTEEVSPSGVTLVPRDGLISETYHYEKGLNQYFSQSGHVFNPQLIPEDDLIYNPTKEQYPVAIHCVVEEGNEECRQSHTTICVIDHHPESNSYVLRALKQKIFVDGLCYLLQEIYGIENKAVNKSSIDEEEIDDHGSECVICMSETRDTLILPCRHLCLCNSCADSLRYQANNCPICRAPFRALLQIRAVQKGVSSHAVHQNTPTGEPAACDHVHVPPGYIPVSLIEALNGPPQYVPKIRSSEGDVTDGGTNIGANEKNKATSPLKPNSGQRRNKSKKNVSTSTNTSEVSTITTGVPNANTAHSVVEIGSDSGAHKMPPSADKNEKSHPRAAQDKLQIVNERNSLKLPKTKRQNASSANNSSSSSSHNDADEDSENEKLSPLLSPGNKCKTTSTPLGKVLSINNDSDNDGEQRDDDVEQTEVSIVKGSTPSSTLIKHKHQDLNSAGDSGGIHGSVADNVVVAINAEDSDYYTPEDTQNSILSPLCPDRAKSGDKLGSLKGINAAGSFKNANSLIKKNLHKKSTSVGNIVGPAGGGNSGTGDLKGNVSSLPDMLDSPLNNGGNNTVSTRSSSDSYSSSSSTKQLLSSNGATAAVTNIIVDDKTALQNAVNV